MNYQALASHLFSAVKKHKSLIATGTVAVGVVATGVTAFVAGCKVQEEYDTNDNVTTKKQAVKNVWKSFIPVVLSVTTTFSSLVAEKVWDKQTINKLAKACASIEDKSKKFKEASKDILGEDAVKKVENKIANGSFIEEAQEARNVEHPDTYFYEPITETWFRSTKFAVKEADYELNRTFKMAGEVSVGTFCNYLGIKPILKDMADIIGWSDYYLEDYGYQWVDIHYARRVTDAGVEYYEIQYYFEPLTLDT